MSGLDEGDRVPEGEYSDDDDEECAVVEKKIGPTIEEVSEGGIHITREKKKEKEEVVKVAGHERLSERDYSRISEGTFGGSEFADKKVVIGGTFTIRELNEGAKAVFSAEVLRSVFSVHPRTGREHAEQLRVGNIGAVVITGAAIVSSFSGHHVPLHVTCEKMPGKLYPLCHGTGRPSGREHRVLHVLYPGTSQHAKPQVVYRKVKVELAELARVHQLFNIGEIEKQIVPLQEIEGEEPHVIMPANCGIVKMVDIYGAQWKIPPNYVEKVKESYVMPRQLSDFVLKVIATINKKFEKNANDLSTLSFGFRAAANDASVASAFVPEDTTVYVGFTMHIEYKFLHTKELHHQKK